MLLISKPIRMTSLAKGQLILTHQICCVAVYPTPYPDMHLTRH